MNFITKNWKTSTAGIIAGVINILPYFGIHVTPELSGAITTIAIVVIGLVAKDGNVSGTGA